MKAAHFFLCCEGQLYDSQFKYSVLIICFFNTFKKLYNVNNTIIIANSISVNVFELGFLSAEGTGKLVWNIASVFYMYLLRYHYVCEYLQNYIFKYLPTLTPSGRKLWSHANSHLKTKISYLAKRFELL